MFQRAHDAIFNQDHHRHEGERVGQYAFHVEVLKEDADAESDAPIASQHLEDEHDDEDAYEDEHDDEREDWITPIGDGVWEIDARAELEDIAKRIDPALAEVEESVDTMGGLTFILAEQVPQVGTSVEHPNGWTIEVIEGDETHVKKVRLHAREEASEEE